MTIDDMPATATKLSFGATFGGGFSSVFGQFWRFIRAAFLPLLLAVMLGLLGVAVLVEAPVLTIPLQVLSLLPIALLGIACCRLTLIGGPAGAIPRPLFGRRTWAYFGYTLLFTLLLWLPAIAIGFAFLGTALLALESDPGSATPETWSSLGQAVLLLFPFYIVYLYFLTRLSLVFPATAVDQKLGLGNSWRLTRGAAGFKLYGVFVLLAIVLLVAMLIAIFLVNAVVGLFWLGPGLSQSPTEFDAVTLIATQAPTLISTLLFEYLAFAIVIAALARAYAQLSGWGGPREDILERFE